MRFFIISFILHLFIVFYFNVFSADEPMIFEKLGNPDVSFSMVEGSRPATPTEKIDEPAKTIEEKKTVKEKKKKVEQPKKEPVKKIEKEVIEVPKKEQEIEEVSSDDTPLDQEASEEDSMETSETNFSSDSFIHLDDGSVVAKNQGVKGLSYGWITNPDPEYPRVARRMKYDRDVVIKVRFLVGYDGKIEDIKYFDNVTSHGFRNEVEKTLGNWAATPITVDGKKVKLYFYKSFKFEKI